MNIRSYAKVNLFLRVLRKRPDGYHQIQTLFERISLHDNLILKPRRDNLITLKCANPLFPCDSSNLCYRSAKLLQDKFAFSRGVDIEVVKRIPIGAGLGGGSSNAAAMLVGLNKLWKLGLSRQQLLPLAKSLGADVPFFLYDATFAIGSGRGDGIKVLRLQRVRKFWHVLIMPKLFVSTPKVYQGWDKLKNFELTKPEENVTLLISRIKQNDFPLTGNFLFNSLEQVTVSLYPQVGHIKENLLKLGLYPVLMSGSGPAVFGLAASREKAGTLAKKLQKMKRSWQVFVARTQ